MPSKNEYSRQIGAYRVTVSMAGISIIGHGYKHDGITFTGGCDSNYGIIYDTLHGQRFGMDNGTGMTKTVIDFIEFAISRFEPRIIGNIMRRECMGKGLQVDGCLLHVTNTNLGAGLEDECGIVFEYEPDPIFSIDENLQMMVEAYEEQT